MLPNFLLIGGQRCGTTWIYSSLLSHPSIYMPQKKELHFFDKYYEQGIEYYTSFFQKANNEYLKGEATPDYLCCELCPERIQSVIPDARFIVVFRNPIDRSYSAYWMFRDFFQGLSFEQALEKFPALLYCGEYIEHIQGWLQFFSRDQFLILVYDDLQKDSAKTINSIYDFLGLESVQLSQPEATNAAIFPRLQNWLSKKDLLWIVSIVKKTPANRFLRYLYTKKGFGKYPPMKRSAREHLINHFSEYNRQLAVFLNRDLSHWNE